MKKTLAVLMALCLLVPAVCARAEAPFIRVDRDDMDAWKGELDNVRFLEEEGMSGSAQFSVSQFRALAALLRERSGNVWIIDCRQETHGFINGIAVSWCGENNGANRGKTADMIEEEEAGLSALIAPAIGTAASSVGGIIMWATELQPFLMGIVVSVVIGIALTLPISSAAICAALGLTGLAGGAALAGCCAQMIGFAVYSFPENGWGGLVSQGIGTSMLQMGNIVKNPKIWLPPILASAITGPIATCVFHLQMNNPASAVASGMGTCGLVGQIGVYAGWVADVAAGTKASITGFDWLGLILISFILPGILTPLIAIPLRKAGWIKDGDLKLD